MAGLAVISTEDLTFFRHHGFNFGAIARAFRYNLTHADIRGASTLSQQTAKNLFLYPGRSYLRKGIEAGLTVLLELLWPKARILDVYLNFAQFGDGIYGIEAASQAFFGKPAKRLEPEEAALLAAILPNPLRLRADRPSADVLKRRDFILGRMEQLEKEGLYPRELRTGKILSPSRAAAIIEVKNHLLFKNGGQVEYIASPNTNGKAQPISPKYLIIHYTADSNMNGVISWFKNPAAEASAHLLIGRDGRIAQMVPFNQRAWHAGQSQWGNVHGLNDCSIGIELVNAGKLVKKQGVFVNWADHAIPTGEVIEATHKNEDSPAFWHDYAKPQIKAAIAVAKALVSAYPIVEILGHDDIAPNRKCDPGPAFPMAEFKSRVFGKS